MPNWKKLVTSGSKAVLAEVTASVGFKGDGSGLTNLPAQTGTITALNNQSANRLVTIGSTTTELDGESLLTWNGNVLGVGIASPSIVGGIHVKNPGSQNTMAVFESGDPYVSMQLKDNQGQGLFQYHGSGQEWYFEHANVYLTPTKVSASAATTASFGRTEGTSFSYVFDANGSLVYDGDELVYKNGGNEKFKVDNSQMTTEVVNTGRVKIGGENKVQLDETSVSFVISQNNGGMQDNLTMTKEGDLTLHNGAVSASAFPSKQTIASQTGANNVDLSTTANHNITITGNITLTPTNFSGRRGQSGIITLIQDSSGGHSITLNSLFKTPRGDSISFDTSANGISLMSYYVIDASNVAVNYLGPFS